MKTSNLIMILLAIMTCMISYNTREIRKNCKRIAESPLFDQRQTDKEICEVIGKIESHGDQFYVAKANYGLRLISTKMVAGDPKFIMIVVDDPENTWKVHYEPLTTIQ